MRIVIYQGVDELGHILRPTDFSDPAIIALEARRAGVEAMTSREAADAFLLLNPDYLEAGNDPGGAAKHWRQVNGVFVVDPRRPARRVVLPYSEFEDRFTESERDALAVFIYATDGAGRPARPRLIQAYNRAVAGNAIDLDAPETVAFMDAITAGGVLTAGRRDEVLGIG